MDSTQLRQLIHQTSNESVNNFLEKEPQTQTRQLDDNSKGEEIGDPISDVKMNQNDGKTGNDSTNPPVSTRAGKVKGGNGFEPGEAKAVFAGKTEQA